MEVAKHLGSLAAAAPDLLQFWGCLWGLAEPMMDRCTRCLGASVPDSQLPCLHPDRRGRSAAERCPKLRKQRAEPLGWDQLGGCAGEPGRGGARGCRPGLEPRPGGSGVRGSAFPRPGLRPAGAPSGGQPAGRVPKG